jgi:two-component system, chemotaxis family, CheB/CheR fusion protein
MSPLPRAVRPWLVMLSMLAAATVLRAALDPLLGERFPLLTYYPMMIFLALVAGAWPAAVAVVLSAVLAEVLFVPGSTGSADLVAGSIYAAATALVILLVERVRRAGEEALRREGAARASETATAAQRGLLATALEAVDAGVHSWDPHTGEAQWDARLKSLFGFGPEQARQSALLERVHPEDRARFEQAIAGAAEFAGPRRYSVEYRILRRDDGALRWMASAGFAVFDGERLARFVGTVRDITEHHRVELALRESEQRFATLAEGSPVLLWVNGPNGNEFVNRAYLEFVGVESDKEVGGHDWSRFVHPDDLDEYLNSYQRAFALQVRFTADFRFRRHDGEYRWMRSDATPRFSDDGEFEGYVGATVDITERRNAEDALRLADRQKDEFLAMLAHELRNPLAPIRNASEILALRYSGDPGAATPLAMLSRQTDHLARLLDDLLDVTRIARGRVTLQQEPLEIGAIIEHAVETVSPLAKAKSQTLRVERDPTPLYVSGDRARLVQCLTNILQNAVKFTNDGGEIAIALRDAGPDLEVSIRDNGIGVPAELLPRVFDLFVQSERTLDRSQGGLGIGLSVVKRLVEMHGGAVGIASEGQGRGTTVTIRLPRIETPADAAQPLPAAMARRRVLVVDDSADAADSLAILLELEGHQVATAYSASAALDAAERLQPDVAFIDIGLPLMDGYEVARRLRANERCRAIRLVALTGYGQPDDRDEARRAGFDHHLVKPADRTAVGAILAEP